MQQKTITSERLHNEGLSWMCSRKAFFRNGRIRQFGDGEVCWTSRFLLVRMNRQHSAKREAMTGQDSWLLILPSFFRPFQILCIVSRSPFRSMSCTLPLKVAKWKATIQTSVFAPVGSPDFAPRSPVQGSLWAESNQGRRGCKPWPGR